MTDISVISPAAITESRRRPHYHYSDDIESDEELGAGVLSLQIDERSTSIPGNHCNDATGRHLHGAGGGHTGLQSPGEPGSAKERRTGNLGRSPVWGYPTSSVANNASGARLHILSVSERFFGSINPARDSRQPNLWNKSADFPNPRRFHLSRKIPGWVWLVLTKCLGIGTHFGERPVLGTALYVLTISTGFMFGISGLWYKIFDIKSDVSKTTVLTGFMSIVIGTIWLSLGIYANSLAARLFSNKNFAVSVRLHSKTIFRISSAGILAGLSVGFLSMNIYYTSVNFQGSTCDKVQLNPAVCQAWFIGGGSYAVLCLLWNLLVGYVLLSVCRTHAIGIRRFMRELEMDGKIYETCWKGRHRCNSVIRGNIDIDNLTEDGDSEEYVWDDRYSPEAEVFDDHMQPTRNSSTNNEAMQSGDSSSTVQRRWTISSMPPSQTRDSEMYSVVGDNCVNVNATNDEYMNEHQREPQVQIVNVPHQRRPLAQDDKYAHQREPLENNDNVTHQREPLEINDNVTHQREPLENNDNVTHQREPLQPNLNVENDHELPNSVRQRSVVNVSNNNGQKCADCEKSPEGATSHKNTEERVEPDAADQRTMQGPHNLEDFIMTNEDILISYWKISCRMRVTSLCLQRWLASWIAFVLIWCANYVIYWTSHEATTQGIIEFIIPLILLLIICAAYAEANTEGQRMIRCMCPTEERLPVLFFLMQQPLQMQVFGFSITYNAILGVLLLFSTAFATRLIMDEIKV